MTTESIPTTGDELKPAMDKARIRVAIEAGTPLDGICDDHGQIFDEFYRIRRNGWQHEIDVAQGKIEQHQAHLDQLERDLKSIPRFVLDTMPGRSPLRWDYFSITIFVIGVLFMIFLLVVADNTVANYILNSGIRGIWTEHPWIVYVISAFPFGLPVVLHAFYNRLSHGSRQPYFIGLCVSALLSGLAWIICYSLVYSNQSQSAADLANSIIDNKAGSANWSDSILAFSQLLTEMLVAAVCEIELFTMIEVRRPATLANQDWVEVKEAQDKHRLDLAGCQQEKDAICSKMESQQKVRERFLQEVAEYYQFESTAYARQQKSEADARTVPEVLAEQTAREAQQAEKAVEEARQALTLLVEKAAGTRKGAETAAVALAAHKAEMLKAAKAAYETAALELDRKVWEARTARETARVTAQNAIDARVAHELAVDLARKAARHAEQAAETAEKAKSRADLLREVARKDGESTENTALGTDKAAEKADKAAEKADKAAEIAAEAAAQAALSAAENAARNACESAENAEVAARLASHAQMEAAAAEEIAQEKANEADEARLKAKRLSDDYENLKPKP